jgi:hypothetical protein
VITATGKVDVVVQMRLVPADPKKPPPPNAEMISTVRSFWFILFTLCRLSAKQVVPLELKSGQRKPYNQAYAEAQVLLYTLLMSDHYGSLVHSLFYSFHHGIFGAFT